MRCGECGNEVEPGAGRFCGRCGATLVVAGQPADRFQRRISTRLLVGLVAVAVGVGFAVWTFGWRDQADPPDAADVGDEVRLGVVDPWERHVGGVHDRRILGVASGDGQVYAVDGAALYAIDATDGTIRWRYAGGEGIGAGPELIDDAVIVTTRGGLVAVDADRGETIWRTRTGDARAWNHLAVSAELVAASGQRGTSTGPIGTVGVFDAGSGDQQWAFDLDGWVTSPLALTEGVLVVATHQGGRDGRVQGLEVATGAPLWEVPVIGAAQPTVHGGTVYAATVREVIAVDPDDGSERWRTQIEPPTVEGEPPPQLAVVDGELRVTFARTQPHVLTLDPADGEVLGRQTVSSLGGDGLATIGTLDDLRHVVGIAWDDHEEGIVRAVGTDGEAIWEQRLDDPVSPGIHLTSPPAGRADPRAWVGTRSGSLVALDLDDGSVAWSTTLPPPLDWRHAPTTDGRLVLVDLGPDLVALRGSDGEVRWTNGEVGDPATRSIGPRGSVFAPSPLRRILELDPTSGAAAAEIDLEPRGAVRALATVDRHLLVGSTSGIHAVDPVHRRQRWAVETDVPIVELVGDREHVAAVDDGGRLLLVDPSDSRLRWWTGVEACTPPALVGDAVVIGTERGLRAFGVQDGDERWASGPSRPACVPVAVADGVVLVTDLVRTVSALDPDDGSTVWTTELDEVVTTPPATGGRLLAVGTAAGVALLDPADGTPIDVVAPSSVTAPVLAADAVVTFSADGVLHVTPLP